MEDPWKIKLKPDEIRFILKFGEIIDISIPNEPKLLTLAEVVEILNDLNHKYEDLAYSI